MAIQDFSFLLLICVHGFILAYCQSFVLKNVLKMIVLLQLQVAFSKGVIRGKLVGQAAERKPNIYNKVIFKHLCMNL